MAMKVRFTNVAGRVIAHKESNTRLTHLFDAQGNTLALCTNSGTLSDKYKYFPNGEIRSSTGTHTNNPARFGGRSGYFYDSPTRTYIRKRILKTDTASWMTRDPRWPWEMPYAYAGRNPTTYIDPSGAQATHGGPSWNPFCDNPVFCKLFQCCPEVRQPSKQPADPAAFFNNILHDRHGWHNAPPTSYWVRQCNRQLKPDDYPLCNAVFYLTFGVPKHYWIETSSSSADCNSIGYGPGGILHGRANLMPGGKPADVECGPKIPIRKSQLECLCNTSKFLQSGGTLPDYGTFCDTSRRDDSGERIHDYNFLIHNCQDFVVAILDHCNIEPTYRTQAEEFFHYW